MSVETVESALRRANAESVTLQYTCGALLAHIASMYQDPKGKLMQLTGPPARGRATAWRRRRHARGTPGACWMSGSPRRRPSASWPWPKPTSVARRPLPVPG